MTDGSKTGFSSVHLSAVEPVSELRPKMVLKYVLKLIFLKCIFEFMINTAPPALKSVCFRQKCLKYNSFTSVINLWQYGAVSKHDNSRFHVQGAVGMMVPPFFLCGTFFVRFCFVLFGFALF